MAIPPVGIDMSQYERIREEQNEAKARRLDKSAAGRKAHWTRVAESRRQQSRAQRRYIHGEELYERVYLGEKETLDGS